MWDRRQSKSFDYTRNSGPPNAGMGRDGRSGQLSRQDVRVESPAAPKGAQENRSASGMPARIPHLDFQHDSWALAPEPQGLESWQALAARPRGRSSAVRQAGKAGVTSARCHTIQRKYAFISYGPHNLVAN
ncbi:hypothetical protein DHEL01_v205991 [Diaporthe helianthi]|uniref:Uncharacterized protein n=1 Tax=Diaporthe helianthi TaxID=158607 RepID=A0A2P5HZE4_DIAHE|nr:hypothetical protein DHEL01_v205991 [Diaporthe helianthi]